MGGCDSDPFPCDSVIRSPRPGYFRQTDNHRISHRHVIAVEDAGVGRGIRLGNERRIRPGAVQTRIHSGPEQVSSLMDGYHVVGAVAIGEVFPRHRQGFPDDRRRGSDRDLKVGLHRQIG